MLEILKSAEYWIIPAAVLGAMVGSFLNVVIFRLPLGLSITEPRWSFCPHCEKRIRPYHNLPIVGWLWLRGRCHDCGTPISAIYPVIECATSLMFVMIWDAIFIGEVIPGIRDVAGDWWLAVAYLGLFAGLLATSTMDIESYTIDIRPSVFAMVLGVVCHAIWGMPAADAATDGASGQQVLGLLPPSICVVGIAMGSAWALTMVVATLVRPARNDESNSEDDSGGEEQAPPPTTYLDSADRRFKPLAVIAFAAVILGLIAWQFAGPERPGVWLLDAGELRGLIACVVFMVLLVLVSLVPRESDDQIIDEIESERDQARSMALSETAWFLPAIAVGAGLLIYIHGNQKMDAGFAELLGGTTPTPGWFEHVQGGAQAVAAMVLAAAMGWTVRILGTLAFRKEAFGTGDIYIMAAIAAVIGFWSAFFAFFLATFLALIGVVATLFRKTSRIVPFGPWLALGAFVSLWLSGPLMNYFRPATQMLWSVLTNP